MTDDKAKIEPFYFRRGILSELKDKLSEEQYQQLTELFDYRDQVEKWQEEIKIELDTINRKICNGPFSKEGLKGYMMKSVDDVLNEDSIH